MTFRGFGFHSLKRTFLLDVFVLFFSLCFCRCASENLRGNEPAWLTYSSSEWGYSILYPAGWEAREAVERTGKGPFFEPDVLSGDEVQKVTFIEREYDMWPGQLQVMVLANPENMSLQQWVKHYRVEDISGGDLIQSRSATTLSGQPAVRFSIFGFDQEIIAVVAENRGHLYYVTFSGANPNDPRQDTHRKILAQMLSSFRFD
jgi:hypothetical protein